MELINISDLITNSSNEVFCYITADNPKILNKIYDDIDRIFGFRQEKEVTPIIEMGECHRKKQLVIELPYSLDNCHDYFKAGLKAFLENNYEDYKIEFV